MGWNPMLEQAHEKIKEWLGAVYSPSQIDRAVHVRPDDGGSIRVKIWTDTNEYRIRVSLRPTRLDEIKQAGRNTAGKLGDAYLGASASARKPRAGEGWTRGNDLPDGKFSKKLWQEIMIAIVKYEAQSVMSEAWKDDPDDGIRL